MSHLVGGRWPPGEEISHINVLELYASKLVLQSLAKSFNNGHIKILLDNTTAISYLNRMGGGGGGGGYALTTTELLSKGNLVLDNREGNLVVCSPYSRK